MGTGDPVPGSLVVVVFGVAGRRAAVSVDHVVETCRVRHVDVVPNVDPCLVGIARYRGRATAVVDAGVLLCGTRSASRRAIVLRSSEDHVLLVVDELVGVRVLDDEDMPLPPLFDSAALSYRHIVDVDGGFAAILEGVRVVEIASQIAVDVAAWHS